MKKTILMALLLLSVCAIQAQQLLNSSLGLSKTNQNYLLYYDCNVDLDDKWKINYSKPQADDNLPSLNISYNNSVTAGKDFQFIADPADHTLSKFKVAGSTYITKWGMELKNSSPSIKYYVNQDDFWYNRPLSSNLNSFALGKSSTGGNEFQINTDGIDYTKTEVLIGNGVLLSSNDVSKFVNGIQTEEVTVAATSVPDYVFDEDYDLRSLSELEKYINQEGHLPEIPSAEMAEKNGIKLSEFNLLLLKKIEELTLYVIELKKEVNDLKSDDK